MNKSHFCHHSEFIEESLFDNNSKCEDCECTVVRVFLTVTKRCRRCRAMNIPSFGRKKAKKNLRGKGGRKVNPRTYKGGGEASPPDVFLRFSLYGQTSAPDVFSRCSFFTDAHFETGRICDNQLLLLRDMTSLK